MKSLLFISLFNLIAITPFPAFCHNAEVAEASIVINSSIDDVWNFIGNNENAASWSVFFSKIVKCPVTDCPQNEGKSAVDIGYTSRGFRNADETGIFWDEEIISVRKEKDLYYKHIRASNFHGYLGDGYQKSWEIKVEREYKYLSPKKTMVTFRATPVKYKDLSVNQSKNPSDHLARLTYYFWERSFTLLAKENTREIFKKNLENIKHIIEKGVSNHPVHPYRKYCNVENFYCPSFLSDY